MYPCHGAAESQPLYPMANETLLARLPIAQQRKRDRETRVVPAPALADSGH